jgi:hypothetical protein
MNVKWHADGEGRCHEGCEQYEHDTQPFPYCRIIAKLSSAYNIVPIAICAPCPFAVLADVLGLHGRRDGAQLHHRGREDPQRVFGITPEMVLAAVKNHLAQQADDEARAALEKRLREQDAMDDPRR